MSALSAARCRYVNSTWPARMRGYSSVIGSLTLSTQFALGPHVLGGGQDLGSGREEILIWDGRADAGVGLNEHVVPVTDQLVHAGRGERHAVLVVLDLGWDPDAHDRSS